MSHFKFNDLEILSGSATRTDKRLAWQGVSAAERRKIFSMNSHEALRAARSDREVRIAQMRAQGERAMNELGFDTKLQHQIFAGLGKLTVKVVDAAIAAQCEAIANKENEAKCISRNKYKLDAGEVTTTEMVIDREWPFHRRAAVKNMLVQAGLLD
jgi:hypothetical protein